MENLLITEELRLNSFCKTMKKWRVTLLSRFLQCRPRDHLATCYQGIFIQHACDSLEYLGIFDTCAHAWRIHKRYDL
jgi:hypothetical protein